jgi:hypothetical protein
MGIVQTACELQRHAHLTQIVDALQAKFPETCDQRVGFHDVTRLCKIVVASRPCRDCHTIRDELLTVAALWNLASDGLDEQSDELLAYLANLIGNSNGRRSG